MIAGVWVPLITPFSNGQLDIGSIRRLVEHYIAKGVDGLVLLGTTGEAPTLSVDEVDTVISEAISVANGRLPIIVGVGGNDTRKVAKQAEHVSRFRVDGLLSVCPYYSRPSQDGLKQHFEAIAERTQLPVIIYNIPYRTGVNLTNDTLFELAEISNVAGVKDSSGSIEQSLDLLTRKPDGFSVLTGEDHLFFTELCSGADGGILASSHVATERFINIAKLVKSNNHQAALAEWRKLQKIVPLLFREANPMPIKYCLWQQGLITSSECRLPLSVVSQGLSRELDLAMLEL